MKQYRSIGHHQYSDNNYNESDLLIIDKSNPDDPQISSSGELELLDSEAAVLHFDFEGLHKIDDRPIYEMYDDNNLIAEYQAVGDTNCTESIHNMGSFAEQYDAQVANVELVPGRASNSLAGRFTTSSRFGVFSIGPFTAGMAHSTALWTKTSEASKTMMLLYFGPNWKTDEKNFLRMVIENGELCLHLSNKSRLKLVEKKMLADDQWHHIAVVMPFNSCKYSQIKAYIDGVQYATQLSLGSDENVFFHTIGRLNVGGYGYSMRTYDGSIQMFEGEIDDVMVWSKPLQQKDILMLLDEQSSSIPVSTSEANVGLNIGWNFKAVSLSFVVFTILSAVCL